MFQIHHMNSLRISWSSESNPLRSVAGTGFITNLVVDQ